MRFHSITSIPLISISIITSTYAVPTLAPFHPLLESNSTPHPSIGINLGLEYGTAAIRWANGTTMGIVKVEGDERYRSLMSRLVDEASSDQHEIGVPHVYGPDTNLPPTLDLPELSSSDPQSSQKPMALQWEEKLSDEERQSRPITSFDYNSDVHIIGELIHLLRASVETHLDTSISVVAVSLPTTIRLPRKTLTRAVESAGLRDLTSDLALLSLSTASVAMVALGKELASTPGPSAMRSQNVLVIEWTEDALVTTIIGAEGTRAVTAIDHKVGHKRMTADVSTTAESHLQVNQLLLAIARLPLHFGQQQSIGHVVPLGQYGYDPTFIKYLKEAMSYWLKKTRPEETSAEPVLLESRGWSPLYAAAEGAAQMAIQAMGHELEEEWESAFMMDKKAMVDTTMKEPH